MANVNVVAATHHHVQSGFAGDGAKGVRISTETDGRLVDDGLSARTLEEQDLPGRRAYVPTVGVVEVLVAVLSGKSQRVDAQGAFGNIAPSGFLDRQVVPIPVKEQVLVDQGHPQTPGR